VLKCPMVYERLGGLAASARAVLRRSAVYGALVPAGDPGLLESGGACTICQARPAPRPGAGGAASSCINEHWPQAGVLRLRAPLQTGPSAPVRVSPWRVLYPAHRSWKSASVLRLRAPLQTRPSAPVRVSLRRVSCEHFLAQHMSQLVPAGPV